MPNPTQRPGKDQIPQKDADLDAFGEIFATFWVPATFNATGPTQEEVVNDHTAFQSALALLTNPATNTRPNIAAKDTARATLEMCLRRAIRYAQAGFRAGLNTEAQLLALNLVPVKLTRTQITPPTDAPILAFTASEPGMVRYRITQVVEGQPVTERLFPYGIVGLYLKETWGANERTTNVKRVNIMQPTEGIAKGTVITATACYYTARGEKGPASLPTTAVVS